MKKARLKITQSDSTGQNIQLLGLSAGIDFYRIAYFLDKLLEAEQVQHTIDIEPHSEVILYESEFDNHCVYLLKNLLHDGYFFPNVKSADYIMLLVGEISSNFIESLKLKLQSLEQVQSIFVIDNKLAAKNKLKYFD